MDMRDRSNKVQLLKSIASGKATIEELISHQSFLIIADPGNDTNKVHNIHTSQHWIMNNAELEDWHKSKEATAATSVITLPHNNR
jgi:microcompartment protein CcmL/EutN